jgi:cytochrome P450
LIAELFGIRPRDYARFRAWSQAMIEGIDVRASPAAAEAAGRATLEFSRYIERELAAKSSESAEDLLGVLANSEQGAQGLSREELLANCLLIITAGHETTANLIGNGVYALLAERAQWELLRERPELVKSAANELLRFDSPVQFLNRVALHDLELAGQPIRRGELVNCVLGSANRDPEAFERPDELDVTRDGPRPLSFGHGIHHCLGAALAQLEVEVALSALLERLPALRVLEEPRRNDRLDFRGFEALRVAT